MTYAVFKIEKNAYNKAFLEGFEVFATFKDANSYVMVNGGYIFRLVEAVEKVVKEPKSKRIA